MLDDLQYIHQKDVQDALGVAEKQWQQLMYTYQVEFISKTSIRTLVIAGMGGSALAAQMLNTWPGLDIPFQIVRDYNLPRFVDANTLFVASSYSGNTEETLSVLEHASNTNAQIVVIASGGELVKIANARQYTLFQIPANLQPRMAVFYNFVALVQLLQQAGVIEVVRQDELSRTADWLSKQFQNWLPTIATAQNSAKKIAQEIMGRSVVIYSGPLLFAAAYKWKISFNENAKNIAWCNQLPEFNHNEFLGWTSHPEQKPYAIIDLRSNLENPQIQKRFSVSSRLLSGLRPSPIIIEAQGSTVLQQLLWTVLLGDFVSLYLALLNGLNPTPVDLIEKFKQELKNNS